CRRPYDVEAVEVGLHDAVEGATGSPRQLLERPPHVVRGVRLLPERVEDRALELAQSGVAQSLNGANDGRIGRVGQVAERRGRARQGELAIFIDETQDAVTGAAEPGIRAAQQPIQLAAGLHRRWRIQRNVPHNSNDVSLTL